MNKLLRAAKKSHITAKIDLNKFNMKETWKTLNNVLGRNKLIKLPHFFKDSDGNKITDSKKKLLITLTNSLPGIGTKLANKISSPDSNYVSPLKSKNQQNCIF